MKLQNILTIGIAALATVAALSFTSFASAQSMNGNWEVTGGTLHGKSIPANVAFTMSLKVAGNTFEAESGNLSSTGSVTANPQASPQQVTFKIDSGTDPGRELHGIYKFEGQTMVIVFSETDQFPNAFESSTENKFLTLNYQVSSGRNNNGGIVRNPGRKSTRKIGVPPMPALPKKDSGNSSAAAF